MSIELNIIDQQVQAIADRDDGTFYDGNAHFPANSVQKMMLVVKSIFDSSAKIPAREDVVDKIEEIRSIVRDGCMPSVEVIFCINGQELLKHILFTFKSSMVTFHSSLNIVLDERIKDEINLYDIWED